jgi:proteasome assembly chaperone 3
MASFLDIGPSLFKKQDSFVHDGVTTKIMCSSFADRHFVIVTQRNKIGNLISGQSLRSADGTVKYDVSTIFGRRDDILLHVYARQIIERISLTSSLPLLLAICLEDEGRDAKIFEEVLNRIEDIKTW